MKAYPDAGSIIPKSEPVVKWAEKKREASALAARLQKIGGELFARGARMAECGNFLVQSVCPECGAHGRAVAKLCRDRLCPICGWRLSLARFAQMVRVLDLATPLLREQNVYAQFVTLTVRNIPLASLARALKSMSGGWSRLRKRAAFRGVIGWARNVEITFNEVSREAHPHFHIILLWDGAHHKAAHDFARHLKKEWREAMQLDYNPIVDARRCYSKHEGFNVREDAAEAVKMAAVEAAKYSVKGSELSQMSDKELRIFADQIKGYRFCEYGGIIKKLRKELGLSDEDYSAEDSIQCKCGAKMIQIILEWNGKDYSLTTTKAVCAHEE